MEHTPHRGLLQICSLHRDLRQSSRELRQFHPPRCISTLQHERSDQLPATVGTEEMGTEADDDECWAQLAANEGWRDDGWGSRATTAADAPPPDSKRQRVLTIVGGAPPQGDLQGFPPGFAGWCTAKEVHHGKLDSPQTGVNGPQTVQPLQTRSPNIEPGKQLSFAGILGRAPTTRPVAPPPKPSAAKSAPQASGEGDDASTAASTLTNGAWALMMSQRANPFGTSGVPKQLVRIIDLAGAAVQPGMRDHVVALLKPDDDLACANVMMRALKCASKGQLTPCEPPSWVRAPWKKLPKPQRAAAFKRLGEQWKEALSDTHFRRWVAATRTGTQHNPSRGENRLFNSLVAALDEGAHGDGTTAGTKRARARVDTLANGQKTNALAAEMLQSRSAPPTDEDRKAALAKATAQVAAGSWREHNRECAGQRNKLSAQSARSPPLSCGSACATCVVWPCVSDTAHTQAASRARAWLPPCSTTLASPPSSSRRCRQW